MVAVEGSMRTSMRLVEGSCMRLSAAFTRISSKSFTSAGCVSASRQTMRPEMRAHSGSRAQWRVEGNQDAVEGGGASVGGQAISERRKQASPSDQGS